MLDALAESESRVDCNACRVDTAPAREFDMLASETDATCCVTSLIVGACCIVRGVPCMCIRTTPQLTRRNYVERSGLAAARARH